MPVNLESNWSSVNFAVTNCVGFVVDFVVELVVLLVEVVVEVGFILFLLG